MLHVRYVTTMQTSRVLIDLAAQEQVGNLASPQMVTGAGYVDVVIDHFTS
jgi:hypothetical protein